jgi:hypothetical protein
MPAYSYRTKDGELVERVYPMSKIPSRIKLDDGRWAVRDIASDHRSRHAVKCSQWPMKSWAAGVAIDQIPEAMEHARKHGVPTEFAPDGDVIFRDRAHRKAYLKIIGMHDRNGGYGD